jgi:tripartite-type tricarboxylate transporter receptor subunit TctC
MQRRSLPVGGTGAGVSIAGPAGVPAPVIERLNGELNNALVDPIFVLRLRDVGLRPRH